MQKAVLIFIALITLSSQQILTNFCWRDSVVRGLGTIPDSCPAGQEKIALLCYDLCPSGY